MNRRKFLKYIPPTIASMSAVPALARAASGQDEHYVGPPNVQKVAGHYWYDHTIYGPFAHPTIKSMIGPRIYTVRVPDVNPRNVTQIVIHTDLQTATVYVKDQVEPYAIVKAHLQLTQLPKIETPWDLRLSGFSEDY